MGSGTLRWAVLWSLVLAATSWGEPLEPIAVTQGQSASGSNEVRIVVPGRLKIVLGDGSKRGPADAGVTGFYDLRHDPDEKYNYAPPQYGFLWPKLTVDPRRDERTGALCPGAGTLEVLEANPVRAVVKYTWAGTSYGNIA